MVQAIREFLRVRGCSIASAILWLIGAGNRHPGVRLFLLLREHCMDQADEQDYYEVLQVSARAHPMIVTKAYRLLAATCHPDNKDSGDEEKFKRLAEAYHVLADPVRRAAYDRQRPGTSERPGSTPPGRQTADDSAAPIRDEQELRPLILGALYDVRRGRPYQPNLSLMALAEMCGCHIEDLQYTLWYLRGKRYIEGSQEGDLSITVEGVDYLESRPAVRARDDRASLLASAQLLPKTPSS